MLNQCDQFEVTTQNVTAQIQIQTQVLTIRTRRTLMGFQILVYIHHYWLTRSIKSVEQHFVIIMNL